jgi:hypothetical protein
MSETSDEILLRRLSEPFEQLGAAHDLQVLDRAQVGPGEAPEIVTLDGGHRAKRRPERFDLLPGQAVVDPRPLPARAHQAGTGQGTQVMRRVGQALADLTCDLVHGALTLGQEVDDLHPPTRPERSRHLGQRVEQRGLGLPGSGTSRARTK